MWANWAKRTWTWLALFTTNFVKSIKPLLSVIALSWLTVIRACCHESLHSSWGGKTEAWHPIPFHSPESPWWDTYSPRAFVFPYQTLKPNQISLFWSRLNISNSNFSFMMMLNFGMIDTKKGIFARHMPQRQALGRLKQKIIKSRKIWAYS